MSPVVETGDCHVVEDAAGESALGDRAEVLDRRGARETTRALSHIQSGDVAYGARPTE